MKLAFLDKITKQLIVRQTNQRMKKIKEFFHPSAVLNLPFKVDST